MSELTYGELMMLCEGHGASAIYERHQEVVVALRQQLTEREQELGEINTANYSWMTAHKELAANYAALNDAHAALQQQLHAQREELARVTAINFDHEVGFHAAELHIKELEQDHARLRAVIEQAIEKMHWTYGADHPVTRFLQAALANRRTL